MLTVGVAVAGGHADGGVIRSGLYPIFPSSKIPRLRPMTPSRQSCSPLHVVALGNSVLTIVWHLLSDPDRGLLPRAGTAPFSS